MADSEFHDENRPALNAEAFDLITAVGLGYLGQTTWAFLWLSDIRCLQDIVKDLKSDNHERATYLRKLLVHPNELNEVIIEPCE